MHATLVELVVGYHMTGGWLPKLFLVNACRGEKKHGSQQASPDTCQALGTREEQEPEPEPQASQPEDGSQMRRVMSVVTKDDDLLSMFATTKGCYSASSTGLGSHTS